MPSPPIVLCRYAVSERQVLPSFALVRSRSNLVMLAVSYTSWNIDLHVIHVVITRKLFCVELSHLSIRDRGA